MDANYVACGDRIHSFLTKFAPAPTFALDPESPSGIKVARVQRMMQDAILKGDPELDVR